MRYYFIMFFTAAILSSENDLLKLNFITRVKHTLAKNKCKLTIFERAKSFIHVNWIRHHNSEKQTVILADSLNAEITTKIRYFMCVESIYSSPIFSRIGEEYVKTLLLNAQLIFYPRNEVVVYAGQVVDHVYVLLRGYCEVIPKVYNLSHTYRNPGFEFGFAEALLDKPSLINVITLTCCDMVRIPVNDIFQALKDYPFEFQSLVDKLELNFKMIKDIKTLEDMYSEYVIDAKTFQQKTPNFVKVKTSMEESETDEEMNASTENLSAFNFILMNRVIHPNGLFYMVWEYIGSAVNVLFLILLPTRRVFFNEYREFYSSTMIAMFLFFCCDVWLKLHLAYFDDNGNLITKPMLTMNRFISNNIVADILLFIPFLETFGFQHTVIRFSGCFHLYRPLKLFRTIEYMRGKRSAGLWLLRYLLVQLSIILQTTTISIEDACAIGPGKEKYFPNRIQLDGIRCEKSIIQTSTVNNTFQVFGLVFIDYMNVFGAESVRSPEMELVFMQVMSMVCVYFFTIAFASHVAAQTLVDYHYIKDFQNDMKETLRLLNKEAMPKDITDNFMTYYENLWNIQLGTQLRELFKPLESYPLLSDILYEMYGKTFKYSCFPNAATSFYKSILSKANIYPVHEKCTILYAQDHTIDLHLIHRGYAYEYTENDSITGVLTRGDFFGCLSRKHQKQTKTVIAQTYMELITISSKEFSSILHKYRQNQSIFFSYIAKKRKLTDANPALVDELVRVDTRKKEKEIIQTLEVIELCKNALSLIICFLQSTVITYDLSHPVIYIISYTCEILKFAICLLYYTPWHPETRNWNREYMDYIWENRMLHTFLLDLLTIFPFEIFPYIIFGKYEKWLKMNRLFEIAVIYRHLENDSYRPFHKYIRSRYIKRGIMFAVYSHYVSCFSYLHDMMRAKAVIYPIPHYFSTWGRLTGFLQNTESIERYDISYVVVAFILRLMLTTLLNILLRDILLIVIHQLRSTHNFLRVKDDFNKFIEVRYSRDLMRCNVNRALFAQYKTFLGPNKPELLKRAPRHIKIPIFLWFYGAAIESSEVFQNCSKHFRRQLARHAEQYTYYNQRIVVRSSVINGTMYFIKSGYVVGYISYDNVKSSGAVDHVERAIVAYQAGESFSIYQGLTNTPQTYSFKVQSDRSTIVELTFSEWSYLLDQYPDDKAIIMNWLKKHESEN